MSTRHFILIALSALGRVPTAGAQAPADGGRVLSAQTVKQVSLEDAIRLADRSSESVESV